MATVTKRDLNQRTTEVLARVIAAGEVVVTERGEPRWRVSSYRCQDDALARAQRQGRYLPPPANPVPWAEVAVGPRYESGDVEALLDEMKGDH
ncbi:type II toxin-antitoxin system Phd/YefM family antitoxin [Kocuria sp.]|uniref:type II toxin-antitoxin system Phd/YefM family antitoxin n=1 Tax=Kocuria sp. TaxID=1871328 RepID=UPI0026DED6FE|nr:type II toxin-antitoxin system prevent-host-death family antitoxin [Kocuria sp.]MDO5618841.1 type II toxin-antitoxin system prevent-host-death family antitoxin [Kocuria sp.]